MVFVEFPNFTKQVTGLLDDEDYRRLQAALIANPDLGDLIRGTGGLRKVRWSAKGRGKRGGVRGDLLLDHAAGSGPAAGDLPEERPR